MTEVRVLEAANRNAPFGMQVWDMAVGTPRVSGLAVRLRRAGRQVSPIVAQSNHSGIYHVAGLPGLADFELGDFADLDSAALAAQRPFRVEVEDPLGRFLPFGFDATLPYAGLYRDALLPAAILAFTNPAASPPGSPIDRIPLFSAPARQLPQPMATIFADLRHATTGAPVPWCLVTASVGGQVEGIGLSDKKGRLAILFPFPKRRRPTLGSPPQSPGEILWNVDLAAYWLAVDPVPDSPDLDHLSNQLMAGPHALLRRAGMPPVPMPTQVLDYRQPLVVRSVDAMNQTLSHALVDLP